MKQPKIIGLTVTGSRKIIGLSAGNDKGIPLSVDNRKIIPFTVGSEISSLPTTEDGIHF
jgi:hypothetical protein